VKSSAVSLFTLTRGRGFVLQLNKSQGGQDAGQ